MSEKIFSKLTNLFADKGNMDHTDMNEVDIVATKHGVDQITGRKAFFAGRDLRSLRESEVLDGGDGSEAKKVNLEDLVKTTLSKGETKK